MTQANAADFFGEGTVSQGQRTQRDWSANPPRSMAEWDQMTRELGIPEGTPAPMDLQRQQPYVGGYVGRPNDSTGAPLTGGAHSSLAGYYAGNAQTRASYDQYHRDNKGSDPFNPFGLLYDALALPTAPIGYVGQKISKSIDNEGAVPPAAPAAAGATGPAVGGGDVPNPDLPTAEDVLGAGPGGGAGGAPDTGATGAGAGEGVTDLIGGLNTYQNDIYALGQDNTGLSIAEAQLKKATALADAQAALQTEQSQRAALGMARGARNRGDRALAERQAVGEAAFVGQEAARTDALRRAETEGSLASLRAQEADADRRFKLEALEKASSLGLNTAALQVDINKINMADATERLRIALGYEQVGAEQAKNLLNFARDMAAIQFQYDQLSVTDQNEADKLLMDKYRIDQETMLRLKELKGKTGMNWDQIFTNFIAGAGKAGTAGLAGIIFSDERVKTNVQPVDATSDEFDEFMGAISANTYEYKEPEKHGDGLRFGLMAQDLEKTRLGKHMVKPDLFGVKTIEVAPLVAATASGLALVHERLQALEEAVKN